MAGGASTRFGGKAKQLLSLDNTETLIGRLVRQVTTLTPHFRRYVVTWREELIHPQCNAIILPSTTSCISESILFTCPRWSQYNIFLVTDCWLPDESMKKILTGNDFMFYGSLDAHKGFSERFAVSVPCRWFPSFFSDLFLAMKHNPPHRGAGLKMLSQVHTKTWPIIELREPLRMVRDVLVWHIIGEHRIWQVPGHFTEVDGMDIDTPEELEIARREFS